VNVETIRYYQRIGLFPSPSFIKGAQRLGFALDEVASLLKLQHGTHCSEARSIAERKPLDVRSKRADLARMEAALADLVAECRTRRGIYLVP
jgi:MerR family mercuric resistance operon transcriptional regulator